MLRGFIGCPFRRATTRGCSVEGRHYVAKSQVRLHMLIVPQQIPTMCTPRVLKMTPGPVLTIRSLRTVAVHVPMKRALGTSARRMDIAPLVLLDLETEEGVTGRAYVFCYLPAATAAVESILHEAAARLNGDRITPAEINAK